MRMGLGADRGRVGMVLLGGAFRQVGIGLALSTLLIGLAALLASVVPAWRAAAVEPMVSLRTE